GESLAEIAVKHAVQEVEPLGMRRGQPVADQLDAVIAKCLRKRPADRFQSMRELDAALAACELHTSWTPEDAQIFWEDRAHRGTWKATASREPRIGLETPRLGSEFGSSLRSNANAETLPGVIGPHDS